MSNKEKYAVYYLSDQGYSASKIAKELSLTTKDVKEIVSQRQVESKPNDKIKTTSEPINSKNLMITETSVKGTKNVAIMTKAASEVNDEFKKKMNSSNNSRASQAAIFRPNNKK